MEATTAVSEEVKPTEHSEEQARSIINKYVLYAMGVGLIPVPLVDVAGVTALQLKMLDDIAKVYGLSFSDNTTKNIISALVGGLGSDALARGTIGSLVKAIPVIGTTLGAVTVPLFSGATTFAVGKVFVQHFESGGTFLDFEPQKVRAYFAEQYQKGKLVVSDMRKKGGKSV